MQSNNNKIILTNFYLNIRVCPYVFVGQESTHNQPSEDLKSSEG
jgi:hypothetical protein